MILYIIVAAVLLVNVINPRILWYIDSWKYKSFQKEAPSSLYLFLCRLLSALGLMILILVIYFQPMYLADLADPKSELSITRQHIYVENGEPEIDTESHNDLSEDQTQRIIDSLRQYTYRSHPDVSVRRSSANLKKLPRNIQIEPADNNHETDHVSEGSCFLCKCRMPI